MFSRFFDQGLHERMRPLWALMLDDGIESFQPFLRL
jgi:hypothetical protein